MQQFVRRQDPQLHSVCNAGVQLATGIQELLDGVADPVEDEAIKVLRRNGVSLKGMFEWGG